MCISYSSLKSFVVEILYRVCSKSLTNKVKQSLCTKSDLTTKCFSCPLCTCTEDHSYIVLMWQQIQHQPHLSLVDREHVILYFSFQDGLWNKFSSNVTDVFCSKIIKVVRKVTLCHTVFQFSVLRHLSQEITDEAPSTLIYLKKIVFSFHWKQNESITFTQKW